jgi:hypothetical protein
MKPLALVYFWIALSLPAATAHADSIRYDMSGSLSSQDDLTQSGQYPGINTGDRFTGSFTFNADIAADYYCKTVAKIGFMQVLRFQDGSGAVLLRAARFCRERAAFFRVGSIIRRRPALRTFQNPKTNLK